MKKALQVIGLLSFIALMNITTVLVLAGFARTSVAGPTDPSCGCDVNGDGAVDLSDPIALLGYLFNGETVACAQGMPPPPPWPPRPEDLVFLRGDIIVPA